jgi:O-antigen/teichoic acid export membrane protein
MSTKTRTSRALAGTITSFLQYAVLMILQFLLVPVVLKFAGKEALGSYSFLLQIIAWAALTDLGFGVSISRSLAQSHGEESHFNFIKVFTTGRTFYIGSNFVFALVVLVIGFNLDSFISINSKIGYEARLCMYFLSSWIILRTPLSLYGEGLIATQNIASVNLIILFANIFRLAFSLLLVYLGAGLIGLIISYIASELMTMYLQKRKYKLLYPLDKFNWGFPDLILFKKMFGFGFTFMMMSIASRLSSSSDNIIIGNLLGASSVAVFYISQMPASLLYQFIWKLTDNSTPALNELYYKGQLKKICEIYFKILRYSLILAVALALGLLLFNKSFINIWTGNVDNFAGDSFTLALSIYSVTQVVIHLNAIMLVAIGDIKKMSFFTIILSGLRVVFAFILIPKLGLKGLMIINVIFDLPILIYLHAKVFRSLNISNRAFLNEIIVPVIKSNSLIFFITILFFFFKIEFNFYSLIFGILIFGLLFILGVIFRGITSEERLSLFKFSKKILARLNI